MKIKSVEVISIQRPGTASPSSGSGTTLAASIASAPQTTGYRKAWPTQIEVANPMSKFPRFKKQRQLYSAKKWPGFGVKITAEDGTWGLGTSAGRPTAMVVEDAFAHILEGEECLAIEKLWDMMCRVSKPFGTTGIASLAISAVDLALWDLEANCKKNQSTSFSEALSAIVSLSMPLAMTLIGTKN